MKKLRSILLAGGASHEVFYPCLKDLQRPFETACTDLRSQVVREVCITLAYLSQQLKFKFASFGETVLPTLMNLIQNSAKVSSDRSDSPVLIARPRSLPLRRIKILYLAASPIPLTSLEFLSVFPVNKDRGDVWRSYGPFHPAKYTQQPIRADYTGVA